MHFLSIFFSNTTEFKPISVFKNDRRVSLVPEKFLGVIDIGKTYFCNNGKVAKIGDTHFFILEKVSVRDQCRYAMDDEILSDGLNVRGIIVRSCYSATCFP